MHYNTQKYHNLNNQSKFISALLHVLHTTDTAVKCRG